MNPGVLAFGLFILFLLVGTNDYNDQHRAEAFYCASAAAGETPYYRGGRETFCKRHVAVP